VTKKDATAVTSSTIINTASHLSRVQQNFMQRTIFDVIGWWKYTVFHFYALSALKISNQISEVIAILNPQISGPYFKALFPKTTLFINFSLVNICVV
jgi:hypothetical protein